MLIDNNFKDITTNFTTPCEYLQRVARLVIDKIRFNNIK